MRWCNLLLSDGTESEYFLATVTVDRTKTDGDDDGDEGDDEEEEKDEEEGEEEDGDDEAIRGGGEGEPFLDDWPQWASEDDGGVDVEAEFKAEHVVDMILQGNPNVLAIV